MHYSIYSQSGLNRGFNLVEAAIVLGVVGLVIGGVWAAASSVQRNNRRQEITQVMLRMGTGLDIVTKGFAFGPYASGAYQDYTGAIFASEGVTSRPANHSAIAGWGISNTSSYRAPSGLYYNVYTQGQTNIHRSISAVDRADCVWIGRQAANLSGVGIPDIFLANQGFAGNWCCSNIDSLTAWMETNCAADTNIVMLRNYRVNY